MIFRNSQVKNRANRLINSNSPYLRQHAYNPVDWYEWGDEAFEKAVKEDKTIFLSIGYSTCHWCHVMAHESFENDEIATYMNENFICIKVDRELRPDIDSVYMRVCYMMNSSCGWPLTAFLTPDRDPFYIGTYFPPVSRMGQIDLLDLLRNIIQYWNNSRDEINKVVNSVKSNLNRNNKLDILDANKQNSEFDEEFFHSAYSELEAMYDSINGGFGYERKFPTPHHLRYLMRYNKIFNDKKSLEMVLFTLKKMRFGGIYDHIGSGFHRYTIEPKFLVPHYEKMLYDQAGLLIAYSEAFQISKDKLFSRTIHELINYLTTRMLSPDGGFYSAEDADSDGEEGSFYLWTAEQIKEILGNDATKFMEIYNIEADGNFTPELGGNNKKLNILHLKENVFEDENIAKFIDSCILSLSQVRQKRVRPMIDKKILADWNGFIIAAIAKAAFVINNEEYIDFAKKVADFILANFLKKDGMLWHAYFEGRNSVEGMLDDYAYLVYGLIEIYTASSEIQYLNEAVILTEKAIELFYDKEQGAFFKTSELTEKILLRPKEIDDSAMPSGNSIMFSNLLRLSKLTDRKDFYEYALKTISYYQFILGNNTSGYTEFLSNLFWIRKSSSETVIAGEKNTTNYCGILDIFRTFYLPLNLLIYLDENREIEKIAPWVKNLTLQKGKTLVYYCQNKTCKIPVDTRDELISAIAEEGDS